MIKVSRGCLGEEELAAVREAFAYGYFGLAYKVVEFEEALESYLGAKHVVTVNSGTSALHLALDALGVRTGDEVIVPSLTFVAAFQAIRLTGATPVPCEVEAETLLMALNDAESRITSRTKALMPVHYTGNTCDLDALYALQARYGLRVVEDAAHAFGSTYKGRRVGSLGDVICFSFDSLKNITCGEGGAIVCQDESLAELMRQKRALGVNRKGSATATATSKLQNWQFDINTLGFRYHMSNINAAIGLEQLKKIEKFIARRREICRLYDQAFQDLSGVQTLPINYDEAAPHIYVIRVEHGRRDALMQYLKAADIETGVNYIPNHLHSYFRQHGLRLPVTERVYDEILTLPLHYGLSSDDVEQVIGRVTDFFRLN